MKELSTVNEITLNTWDELLNYDGSKQFIAHLSNGKWMVINEFPLDPDIHRIKKVVRQVSKFSFDDIDYEAADKAFRADYSNGMGVEGVAWEYPDNDELWNELLAADIPEKGIVNYKCTFIDSLSGLEEIKKEFPLG